MRAARSLLFTLAALLLAGCASVGPRSLPHADPFSQAPIARHLERNDGVGDCARLLREIDRQVVAAGARDVQDLLVPGFPYLRADRLAESLAAQAAADEARFRLWRGRLAQLDRAARVHELRNATTSGGPVLAALGLDGCRTVLMDADSDAPARAALQAAVQVPDDYSTAMRALGLYPLTRLAFAAGIRDWHRETREVFALPVEALPVTGRLRSYVPEPDAARGLPDAPDRFHTDGRVQPITRDALGMPQVASLAALLARHAPVIEVDETGEFDRIGPLAIHADRAGGAARVDLTQPPVLYARLAVGRLGGVLRPQLVYTAWFPARPKSSALDPLGGELDALVWRVTLDDDGRALVYDSIHACGCYHQFFATEGVRARATPPADQGRFDEGLFMPQDPLAAPRADERIVLRVSSRAHYLQRVMLRGAALAVAADAIPYRLRDENELRSLTVFDARAGATALSRSAYDARGFIPGTERLERFFFWPMGIESAGQMRQWGRHATAFVGRRHFDDPGLLDRYFELREGESRRPAATPVAALTDHGQP